MSPIMAPSGNGLAELANGDNPDFVIFDEGASPARQPSPDQPSPRQESPHQLAPGSPAATTDLTSSMTVATEEAPEEELKEIWRHHRAVRDPDYRPIRVSSLSTATPSVQPASAPAATSQPAPGTKRKARDEATGSPRPAKRQEVEQETVEEEEVEVEQENAGPSQPASIEVAVVSPSAVAAQPAPVQPDVPAPSGADILMASVFGSASQRCIKRKAEDAGGAPPHKRQALADIGAEVEVEQEKSRRMSFGGPLVGASSSTTIVGTSSPNDSSTDETIVASTSPRRLDPLTRNAIIHYLLHSRASTLTTLSAARTSTPRPTQVRRAVKKLLREYNGGQVPAHVVEVDSKAVSSQELIDELCDFPAGHPATVGPSAPARREFLGALLRGRRAVGDYLRSVRGRWWAAETAEGMRPLARGVLADAGERLRDFDQEFRSFEEVVAFLVGPHGA